MPKPKRSRRGRARLRAIPNPRFPLSPFAGGLAAFVGSFVSTGLADFDEVHRELCRFLGQLPSMKQDFEPRIDAAREAILSGAPCQIREGFDAFLEKLRPPSAPKLRVAKAPTPGAA